MHLFHAIYIILLITPVFSFTPHNSILLRQLLRHQLEWTIRERNYLQMAADDGNIVDAEIIDDDNRKKTSEGSSSQANDNQPPTKKEKRDTFRGIFRGLANLSLKDYKWRSNLFKTTEADRRVEESLARMRGEDPSYVRPMDAGEGKIGPLGKAERNAVQWLSNVIEEEGSRAKKIASSDGNLVRPIDLDGDGPLSRLERKWVSFFERVRDSEKERASKGLGRPMELSEETRGPLGEAEFRAVNTLKEIRESEKMRMEYSRRMGGEVVRPIDVPGPLGEMEKVAMEVVTAERKRASQRQVNGGKIVRPKDASLEGPLGKAERTVSEAMERLKMEEEERFRSIQKVMEENRPMEISRDSPLGVAEAIIVGVLRGPKLIARVVERVKELLQSEELDNDDKKLVQKSLKPAQDSNDVKDDKKKDQ